MSPSPYTIQAEEYYFSPVQGGPFRKLRKALGFVPEHGPKLGLRIVLLVAFAWLPVMVGAIIAGQALTGGVPDPLLRHFGVHARFLLAVPLLFFAETIMERIIPPMVRHFVHSGLVEGDNLPRFRDALAAAVRFRDSFWGTALVLAVITLVITFSSAGAGHEEMSWAVIGPDSKASFGFAGWWFTFVSRPIFSGVLTIWVWRILALWTLFWKVSKLKLRLVASHPDQVGGLGFLEGLTVACSPIVLAISAVLAGRWGHDVLYHGVHVESLRPLALAFLVMMLLLFIGPLVILGRSTRAFKREKLLEYSALVGNHGNLIHQKWIHNRDIGTPKILNAPELGPAVDVASIYEAVAAMRFAPIGKSALVTIVAASLLPMLPVVAIEIPIGRMLSSLAGALL